jgi:uncharacterized protein (TIGR00255 family)
MSATGKSRAPRKQATPVRGSLRSMTGYGSGAAPVANGRIVVEIRSVNSRFLELKVALPREHASAESELREAVQAAIERGRVDVVVRREGAVKREVKLELNRPLARAYVDAWRAIKRELRLNGEVDLALLRASAADIVRPVEVAPDPARDLAALRRALRAAVAQHRRDREREGAHLARDMRSRIARLEELRGECAREVETLKPLLAERLASRITALIGTHVADPTRLMQEVAIALDRSDVSEEVTRLGSHLAALRGLLQLPDAVGKRFEFLLQETLREVNTIGSKANHLPITSQVLAAKAEIEKLREQVQNVE